MKIVILYYEKIKLIGGLCFSTSFDYFFNISRSSYIHEPSDHRPIVPWLMNIRSNSGMGREGGGLCTNIYKELVMGSKTGEVSMITTTVHQIRGINRDAINNLLTLSVYVEGKHERGNRRNSLFSRRRRIGI